MDMLRRVKIEYELSNVKWAENEDIFHSESGKKRIRIWKDKQLLGWHVKWRDEISKQSGILLDRMIRCKTGEPFFICEKGWATIHDEIEGSYPTLGREKEWGRLIGTMLTFGLKQSDECQRFQKKQEVPLTALKQKIDQLTSIDPMAKLVLERSYFEAFRRNKKMLQLKEQIQQKKLPILIPFSSLSYGKEVFSNLFWVSGSKQPVQGYEPIRKLLEEWLEKNGEESTQKLLDQIEPYFSLRKDQGVLLLAELLTPTELRETVLTIGTTTDQSITDVMDDYFKRWEKSRQLVLILSRWIEKDREKAVAK